MSKFMLALQVMGYLSVWVAQARADGKITFAEIQDLLQFLGTTLDVKELATLTIEVPAPPTALAAEQAAAPARPGLPPKGW